MNLTSTPTLEPITTLPVDDGLPGLPSLFDDEWVWNAFCTNFGEPGETPRRIRPRQIRYQPGKRALVSYVVEWESTVLAQTRVTAIIDKGEGRGALIYTEREIRDTQTGESLATLSSTTVARGEGGFGGRFPSSAPPMTSSWSSLVATAGTQLGWPAGGSPGS